MAEAVLEIGTRGRVYGFYRDPEDRARWEWHASGPNGSRSGTEATEALARDAALAAYADLE